MQTARAAAVLLFAAIAVAAERPSGETPAAPPAEDSIAAAKRDLEAIKAAGGMTAPPQAAVPSFTAPALHLDAPGPKRMELPWSAAEAAAAKKSANWLVDAMTAKPDRTTGARVPRRQAKTILRSAAWPPRRRSGARHERTPNLSSTHWRASGRLFHT